MKVFGKLFRSATWLHAQRMSIIPSIFQVYEFSSRLSRLPIESSISRSILENFSIYESLLMSLASVGQT